MPTVEQDFGQLLLGPQRRRFISPFPSGHIGLCNTNKVGQFNLSQAPLATCITQHPALIKVTSIEIQRRWINCGA